MISKLTENLSPFEILNYVKDSKDNKEETEIEAIKFIKKYSTDSPYNSEILLLPLCVMANAYDNTYKYRREIYNEFSILKRTVQTKILELAKININVIKSENFFTERLQNFEAFIEIRDKISRPILYDNGKYLERALLNHGNKKIPDVFCSYENYYFEDLIMDILLDFDIKNPIEQILSINTNFGNGYSGKEILISYEVCLIAQYLPFYLIKEEKDIGGCEDDFKDLYMEDLFLKALLSLYLYSENK